MKYSLEKPLSTPEIENPDTLYGFITFASRYFMSANQWDENLGFVLDRLQAVTTAGRICLFSADSLEKYDSKQDIRVWSCSKRKQQSRFSAAPALLTESLIKWIPALRQNRVIRSDGNSINPAAGKLTECPSLIIIPVFSGNDWWGALTLEFSADAYRQKRMEHRIIRFFCQMMGSAIHRQRLIDAIKVDKSYFEELFESSPFGIAVLNLDGELQHINRGFTNIFGYDEKDLAGKKLDDILPAPEERENARELTERSLAGEEVSFETIRYRKDGAPLFVSVLVRQLHPTPFESSVYSIYIDITERVKTQQQLTENKTKYQSLFETSSDGICIFRKGLLIEANHRFYEMLGCRPDQVIGSSIFNFSPEFQPDGSPSIMKGRSYYRKALSGETAFFEWLHQRPDGSRFFGEVILTRFELFGQLYAQGILRDISRRKATEEHLQKRYEFINFLSKASADLINLDPAHIDKAITEALMYSAKFANCGRGYVYLIDPVKNTSDLAFEWEDSNIVNTNSLIRRLAMDQYAPLQELLNTRQVLQVQKSQLNGQDDALHIGELFDSLGIKALIIIPMLVDNHYTGFLGFHSSAEMSWPEETLNTLRLSGQIIANAIDRKRVNRELSEAKQKAEESDRLKTAFLASMSHEIRTPMNHIIGFIELLKDPSLSETERNEFLSIIRNSGNHLLSLIDDIIDIAKIESGQMELHPVELSLNDFLNDLYLAFREQFHKSPKSNIHFGLDLPATPENCYIQTDTMRLRQVITNLLSNAIKFTHNGHIRFGFEKQDEHTLRFFVEDTGIGIPKEKQQTIFERFRQLDYSYSREYGGTGLGLAISKGLVELLGGEIGVKSEPSVGSTFYFTIPYIPLSAVQQQAAVSAKTSGKYNFEGKTILIVEDDEINYHFLNIILERTGAQILHAADGQKAIDMVKANHVDLILMDIRIPVIDGYTATRMVKNLRPDLPVIAQTAHALDDEKNLCIEAGANDYMAKPINRKQLLLKISRYLINEE